jgi:NADH dehydrogenase
LKVAITGGTGFVGRHLAEALVAVGDEVVLIARGMDERDTSIRDRAGITFVAAGTSDVEQLRSAFAGCDAVAHCAGINREIGDQTYATVHVQGTRNVVEAAKTAGVDRIAFMSFLRARPDCGSLYHESKWAGEEIFRGSGLQYTIVKAGMVYGRGDHMLDHLSHAFHTFPFFAMLEKDQPTAPLAVEDLVRVLEAAVKDPRLANRTIAVVGPERLPASHAIRRVAAVVGKQPPMVRLPVFVHMGLARLFEALMVVPLVARAQVRILSEDVTEVLPSADSLPEDLRPRLGFSEEQIRGGLPKPGRFGAADLRIVHLLRSRAKVGPPSAAGDGTGRS